MADSKFTASLDTKQFDRGAADIITKLDAMDKKATASGDSIDQLASKLGKGLAALGASFSAVSIVKQVAEVRGQFQQLEVAFNTMLGSKEKADALMTQMIKTAATTPFDLQSVAGGAKQLLAYGESADTVNDTLIRLGNIASGIGAPLGDIAYLYGTTMTQGRLYTQDLNQFTGRGIPMIKLLAQQFDVAEDKVKGLVEAGKVGFPEVRKAIEQLTDEGGMFFNLMAEQSKTISGKISNLGDAFDSMFNDIGKSTQGAITGALDAAISLIENYKEVGRIILELAATYGTYKAVLIAVAAAQRINAAVMREAVLQKKLAAASNVVLSNSEAVAAARSTLLTKAYRALTAQIQRMTAAMMKNPYMLAAAAVAALGYALYKVISYQSDYEKSVEKMSEAQTKAAVEAENESRALDDLIPKLRAAVGHNEEYQKIKDEIVKKYGQYHKNLATELDNVSNIDSAYTALKKSIQDYYDHKAYLQERDRITSEHTERRTEKLKKLYEELQDDQNLSNVEGAELYHRLVRGLNDGSLSFEEQWFTTSQGRSYKTQKLTGLDAETQALYDKWKATGGEINKIKAIAEEAKNYNAELAELDRMFAHVKDMQAEDGTEGGAAKENNQLMTLEQLIAKIKEAESAYKSLQEQAKAGKETTSAVSDKGKELDELKKQYQLMTGQAWDAKGGKGGDKAESDAVKAARAERQLLEDELRQRQRLENEARQQEIDAMAEGLEKQLAQLKLSGTKQRQELERQEREWQEIERRKIEDSTGKAYAGQDVTISKTQSELLAREAVLLDNAQTIAVRQALAGQYETIVQKAARQAAKSASDARILSEYGLTAQADESRRKNEETQNQLGTEYLQQSGQYETYRSELADMAAAVLDDVFVGQLEKMIADAEQQLVQLQAANDVPTAEILTIRGKLGLLKSTLKDVRNESDKTSSSAVQLWGRLSGQLGETSRDFHEAGDTFGGVAGDVLHEMGNIADFAGSAISSITTIVTGSSTLMKSTSTTAAESIKTVERASVILAIIGAALQLAQGIAKLFKKSDYMDEILKKVDELNKKIEDTLYKLRADDSQFDSIFGSDSWGRLVNNADLAQSALEGFNSTVAEMANGQFHNDFIARLSGDTRSFREMLGEAGEELSDFEVMQKRIANMRVQVQHRTWFRSAKSKSVKDLGINLDEGMELREYMAALGEFAESDLFGKMSKADKEFIEQALQDWERYQEAVAAMEEQMSAWFGDIQSALGDAIKAGFEEGEDAAEQFRQSVAESINSMLMDLLISQATGGIFDAASKEMTDLLLNKGGNLSTSDINALADIVMNATDQAWQQAEAVAAVYEKAQQHMADRGYAVESGTEANGLSGAIEGASQESIDLLSGYCNAVRIQQAEAIELQRQALAELAGINTNTADTAAAARQAVEILTSMNNSDTLRASGL